MKKYISIIIYILVCLIFIPISSTLAFEDTEKIGLDNYNTLYGIEKLEVPQIVLNSDLNSVKKTIKYLAIFIEFADSDTKNTQHLDDEISVENAQKIFNSDEKFEMNTVNGIIKVPSFKKYYEKQSYGKLSINTEIFPRNNGKVVSYTDSHPIGYYLKYSETNPIGYKNSSESLQRETELVNNAVSYVSSQIAMSEIIDKDIDSGNDGIVDAISFIIEGAETLESSISWGDLLWSHKMDNNGITSTILGKRVVAYNLIYAYNYSEAAGVFSLNRGTYGTIIHEFGHTLGYVDLYRFAPSTGDPVGFYDIMGKAIGSNPQNFLTYFISEYQNETNWHDPLPIVDETTKNITLYKPSFIDPREMRAIKIQTNKENTEYFIIEYHEKQNTYSSYSADETGIIVYRVNEQNKFLGNKDGGMHGENDHIFVFRPNETGLGDGKGELSKATLNKTRSYFGKEIGKSNDGFDNKTIYYSDGSNSGIIIEVTSQTSDSITFNVILPEMQGTGTKEDPYLIHNTDSFLYLMKQETKNKYYKLVNNLDFANVKQNYPKINFKGNLEGNNKVISNITAVGTGVFNNIGEYDANSIIQNLTIENIISTGDGNHLGGFSATITNATLKNIHVKSGSISNISSINDLASTGGFAGSVSNTTIIENCSSSVNVSSENNVGGFIGINSNAYIKDSYSDGEVTGKSNIGGFIGIQCITDTVYKIPENVCYDYTKAKVTNAVGGYALYLHNLTALPADSLGKGIEAISGIAGIKGDVNGDGKVNTLDAVKILQYVAKKIVLTSKQSLVADVNGDGKINTLDAVKILQYVAKKITTL